MSEYIEDSENGDITIRDLSSKDVWDFENGFYWHTPPSRLAKLLAHYELYQSISGLPGEIFELGVYKASSLVRFASFRSLLENVDSRKIVGFDAFGRFPRDSVTTKQDLAFIDQFESDGGDGLSKSEIVQIFSRKGFSNISLQQGNVFETLPEYIKKHPECRIALLHLDMDVKEPTAFALELLWDRLVRGGIVVIDDYGSVAGATDAIDDFANKHDLQVEKLPYYSVPSFIRKTY